MSLRIISKGRVRLRLVWTKDNQLYFQLTTMGDVRLYFASLEGEVYPASPENEHVYGYDVSGDGEFALVAVSNSVNPGELYKQTIATGERIALTSFNETYLEEVELVEPEAIVYKGAKEWDVHGWLMKPAGFEEGQKYPLIVKSTVDRLRCMRIRFSMKCSYWRHKDMVFCT